MCKRWDLFRPNSWWDISEGGVCGTLLEGGIFAEGVINKTIQLDWIFANMTKGGICANGGICPGKPVDGIFLKVGYVHTGQIMGYLQKVI